MFQIDKYYQMASFFYNTILRKNSTFMAFFLVTAVVAEQTFESAVDNYFDRINRGVSKCLIIIYS